jgi:CBS domain-containing protein
MFAVYGLQGRLYSGPLEQVRELGAVQAVARVRAPAAVQKEDQPWLAAVLAGRTDGQGAEGSGAAPRQQALAAYAQTAAPSRQALSQVQQLMSRKLVTVPLAATLGEAWTLLARGGVGQAPVLDPAGMLVGLIGRADLLPPAALTGDPAAWTQRLAAPVAEAMWSPVPVAQPETALRQAAQLLLDLGLPGLPVVDEQGGLQGFLSRSDLLRALTHEPPLDLWS